VSYYRGDYYAGGFWSSLGGAIKGIGSAAASFIPGIGGGVSKLISAIPTGGAKSGVVASAAGAGMSMVKAGASAVSKAVIKHPVLSAAGAAGVTGMIAGAAGSGILHPAAKAALRAQGISVGKKHRRMNIANGKALNRATRRLHAFAKRYRKVIGFVSPHKPKGRMYFKKRKRAA
jgi:hypothetical protein